MNLFREKETKEIDKKLILFELLFTYPRLVKYLEESYKAR